MREENIAWLHRARDREVYRNNREKHQESDDYDLLEAVEEEKVKMEKGLPNFYEELKSKLEAYRLIVAGLSRSTAPKILRFSSNVLSENSVTSS